jgi:hypothetical protein
MANWRDQWDRLNRTYSLVHQSSTAYRSDRPNSDYYRDELFSFFETCLHMRDWLWNDPSVVLTREDAGKLTMPMAVSSWRMTSRLAPSMSSLRAPT